MRFIVFILCLFWSSYILGQGYYTLRGVVHDAGSDPLTNSQVLIRGQQSVNTLTNENGEFVVENLPAGKYVLRITHLGFEPYAEDIQITSDQSIVVVLQKSKKLLQEVVVISDGYNLLKKRETRSTETAGREFIRENNQGSLMQTLKRLPGVQSIGIGSGQSKPVIRGLGFNRVVVTEHGIKHEGQQWGADHGLEIDQFAQDKVELIKGPASLMYGSDAIAGVINLKQNGIPGKNTMDIRLDMTGKTNNDLLGGSAFLAYRKNKWFFTSRVTLMDYADFKVPADSVDIYSFRVPLFENRLRNTAGNELNYHFSTGIVQRHWSTRLFASYLTQQSGFFANAHGLEPRRVNMDIFDRSERDILFPRQTVDHFKIIHQTYVSLPWSDMRAEMGYQNNLRREYSTYTEHGFMPPLFPDSLGSIPELEREFDKKILSGNLRWRMKNWGRHSFTFGLNADYHQNEIAGRNFIIPSFRQWSTSVFVLDQWHINDNWRSNAGIRFDHVNLDTESYADWFPSQGDFLERASQLNKSFNSLTGSVGAVYNKNGFLLKANLGNSFRVPTAKELAANGVNYHHFSFEKGDSTLQAERSYQFDMGLEYSEPLWNFRLSPFVSYFPNYIYLNPSFLYDYNYGAGNQVFNYTETEVFRVGSEVSVFYQIHPAIRLGISGEYLYSEQLSGGKKGFTLPFSPPSSFLSQVDWSVGRLWFLKQVTLSADWRMTGAQNSIVPPEKPTDAWHVFSFATGGKFQSSHFSFDWRFRVNNVFDRFYQDHTSYYRLIGLPEAGRNFLLSIHIPLTVAMD